MLRIPLPEYADGTLTAYMVFTVRHEGLLKSTCFASAKAVLLTNESSAFNEQKHCFSALKTSTFKRVSGKRVDRRILHKIHKGKYIS